MHAAVKIVSTRAAVPVPPWLNVRKGRKRVDVITISIMGNFRTVVQRCVEEYERLYWHHSDWKRSYINANWKWNAMYASRHILFANHAPLNNTVIYVRQKSIACYICIHYYIYIVIILIMHHCMHISIVSIYVNGHSPKFVPLLKYGCRLHSTFN